MEEDTEQRDASGPTRSQNVVYTLPNEWSTIAQFLSSAIERVDPAQAATQVLVVTGDDDASVAITSAVVRLAQGRGVSALPVTSARRAQRLLREQTAHVVAGTPAALAELVSQAALKLDAVRTLVVAWADDLLDGAEGDAEAVEAVLAEVPKEASRIVVSSDQSPAVESFIERYLRRPRRVGTGGKAPSAAAGAVNIDVLTTASSGRAAALRRLLDALDPASAAVVTRTPESEVEARAVLASLGFGEADPRVTVVTGALETGSELAVLYDVPVSADALAATSAGGPTRIVALATPRQLAHLRALAGGGTVAPLVLPDLARQARRREDRLREELRAELATGFAARELLAIEPLLADHDAAEVAAAALRLLDRARAGVQDEVRQAAMSFTSAAPPGWVRVFMTVGERDGAQRGDLVGAIANESDITSDQIGKIDLRDTHTIVQVASSVADKVIEAMNGALVKGRRVAARLERERTIGARPERPAPDRGGDRPPPRRDRAERSDRDDRPARPARPGGFDRGDRGDRGDRPRPARPGGFDRGDRGDRPARPTRPGGPPRAGGFDRGDRGERGERPSRPGGPPRAGGFDRGERSDRPARPARPGAPRAAAGRFERSDRPSGPPRAGGPARGAGGRFERAGGPPRPPREDRGPVERGDYAAKQRRDAVRPPRDDFAERAERLKRSKRTTGPRTRPDGE